jgi:hypothetical protein
VQDAMEVERQPAGVGSSSRGGQSGLPQQPPVWEEGDWKCDFPDFRVEVAGWRYLVLYPIWQS